MRPAAQHLRSLCPEVPEELVREHLKRLDDEYFERFEIDRVVAHLRGLRTLASAHPVEVLVEPRTGGWVDCSILAYDYPSAFSLITGVLCGMGASILSGDIFTYAKAIEHRVGSVAAGTGARSDAGRSSTRAEAMEAALGRRRIIDHFWCAVGAERLAHGWAEDLRARFAGVFAILEAGGRTAVDDARQLVNELVTRRLVALRLPVQPALLPVDVDFDNDSGPFTRLTVVAQDTPAFLYAFSNALALQGISIERVRIRTEEGRVRDEIDFVDAEGKPVRDAEAQSRIRLSVLLTKQFTYFLDAAPDPFTALARFEQLVERFVHLPEGEQWIDALGDPRLMEDLARLLGASDYLWEDFIRSQYEALLPTLAPHIVRGARVSVPSSELRQHLAAALEGSDSFEDRCDRLNAFKDAQIFRVDLDHILDSRGSFRELSERLTRLAEVVVETAVALIHDELRRRYGTPRTVAGLEAAYAIFGLGKLGGSALGYASDIELLVVYGDNGETDGLQPVSNTEFFSELARRLPAVIRAKREGIFEVDLRLRPYGSAGPMASSLEQFCVYYGAGGPAHSAERLALVRLRAVAGSPDLGRQVERLRDQFLYFSGAIDRVELEELRQKQYAEKLRSGGLNAKFSSGALVDLEYSVQRLQLLHGGKDSRLRTPSVHRALEVLESLGVVDGDEGRRLVAAYDFLRRLINGLRMLRGSAKDLELPALDSDEYLHLARRMGYERAGELEPTEQLHVEFETRTAAVRAFVGRVFGPESLPGPLVGNAADLVLSDDPPAELRTKVLGGLGFRRPEAAYADLRVLAGDGEQREIFASLAVLACDRLRFEPDPDMALGNWERFLRALDDPIEHYRVLLSQPRRLGILVGIFSRSQFLADALIRDPEFFDAVTQPADLERCRKRADLERDLRARAKLCADGDAWQRSLRVFRRREMLRVAVRDMCLEEPIEEIVRDLSVLAEALVHVAVQEAWHHLGDEGRVPPGGDELPDRLCVLAFGKLGGQELNYSSDIDILCVYDGRGAAVSPARAAGKVIERLLYDLSAVTDEGYAYRVDLRLRPWGDVGEIASSIESVERYYRDEARLWEIQALLKLRPIAGNQQLGYDVVERLRSLLLEPRDMVTVSRSIEALRREAIAKSERYPLASGIDVKNGRGGIRDVEFLVQGLQLVHAARFPELLTGQTLAALASLGKVGVIHEEAANGLREDYIFLRRVEHYLQILHDRQTHVLPRDERQLETLARRMLGSGATAGVFLEELESRLRRVRRNYQKHLLAPER